MGKASQRRARVAAGILVRGPRWLPSLHRLIRERRKAAPGQWFAGIHARAQREQERADVQGKFWCMQCERKLCAPVCFSCVVMLGTSRVQALVAVEQISLRVSLLPFPEEETRIADRAFESLWAGIKRYDEQRTAHAIGEAQAGAHEAQGPSQGEVSWGGGTVPGVPKAEGPSLCAPEPADPISKNG